LFFQRCSASAFRFGGASLFFTSSVIVFVSLEHRNTIFLHKTLGPASVHRNYLVLVILHKQEQSREGAGEEGFS